jgi:hypothetical protein
MLRGYAIGLGAGTQALILMAGELTLGPPSELSRALLMTPDHLTRYLRARCATHPVLRKSVQGVEHESKYLR